MARLLHVADLHQGLTTHGRIDPTTGLNTALLSTARCWNAATELAVERGVDVLVVAGDAFNSRKPDNASLNLFDQGLNRVREANIPTVIINGNHDGDGDYSIINLFHETGLVYAITRPEIVEVEGIRIGCLPWSSRNRLLANRPGTSRTEADRAVAEALERILDQFRAESSPPDVITGHWTVQGVMGGGERDLSVMVREPVIPLHAMEGPWSHALWGHIHRQQVLEAGGTEIIYAGSVDRISFAEEHEAKVAIEVEVGTRGFTLHGLPARRFVTWEASGALDVGPSDVVGAIIRVRGEDQSQVTSAADAARDLGAATVLAQHTPKQETRARSEIVTEDLDVMGALEEYMRVRELDEDRRPAIRDTVKRLMEEAP